MKPEDFKHITYFTQKEIEATGANIKDIDYRLIWKLNWIRYYFGYPIKITSLTTGRHEDRSYHYKGLAVDFKFLPGRGYKQPHPNSVVQQLLTEGFKGIGVYKTFYHADLRNNTALWKRVNGVYLPLIERM